MSGHAEMASPAVSSSADNDGSTAIDSASRESSPLSSLPSTINTPEISALDITDNTLDDELLLLGGEEASGETVSVSAGAQETPIVNNVAPERESLPSPLSVDPTTRTETSSQPMQDPDHTQDSGIALDSETMDIDPPVLQGPLPINDSEIQGIDVSEPVPQSTDNPTVELTDADFYARENLDPRIERSALSKDADGQWVMPRGCEKCLRARAFCSRGSPCKRCINRSEQCTRETGTQFVRSKQHRQNGKKRQRVSKEHLHTESASDDENHEGPSNPGHDPVSSATVTVVSAKRGRPKKIQRVNGKQPVITQDAPSAEHSMVPEVVKAQPIGIPPVWAESRSALCETLLYYRSFQSGPYHHDGIVYGSLFDGSPGPRDYIDGRIAIAHAGGASTTGEDGGRKLSRDQSKNDGAVKSLIANMTKKFPVALILGSKCELAPTVVPHRYCVMDFFKVTTHWQEKCPTNGRVRQKFRYEKLDCSETGWWDSCKTPNTPETVIEQVCEHCHSKSPLVYAHGWCCLNSECADGFWKEFEGYNGKWEYATSFLNARTPWEPMLEVPPYQLKPPLPDYDGVADVQYYTVSSFRGICCPSCNGCIPREMWDGWYCETEGCGFSFLRPDVRIRANLLGDPYYIRFTGPAVCADVVHDRAITDLRHVINGKTVIQYTIPGCGDVYHLLATKVLNARNKGSDWLLNEYQSLDQPFKRRHMMTGGGDGLTSQFTYNSGTPYKYVAAQEDRTWDQAPPAARNARDLLQDLVRQILPDALEFNELLSVAYYEGGKMGYHDDGEKGLGPTVASVSLGGGAIMKFRRKSQKKRIDNRTVATNNNKPCLELKLKHGDIMIMHGADIQAQYEHTVISQSVFRVAATARYIAPSNYMESHRWNKVTSGPVVDTSPGGPQIDVEMSDQLTPAVSEATDASSDGAQVDVEMSDQLTSAVSEVAVASLEDVQAHGETTARPTSTIPGTIVLPSAPPITATDPTDIIEDEYGSWVELDNQVANLAMDEDFAPVPPSDPAYAGFIPRAAENPNPQYVLGENPVFIGSGTGNPSVNGSFVFEHPVNF